MCERPALLDAVAARFVVEDPPDHRPNLNRVAQIRLARHRRRAAPAHPLRLALHLLKAPAPARQVGRAQIHPALRHPGVARGGRDDHAVAARRLGDADERPAQQRAEYRRAADAVQVYVAYYAQQRSGAELVNSENTLFDNLNERRLGENVETLTGADGVSWTVRALRIHTRHGERLIWSWYVVAGHPAVNPLAAKLYEARARIVGGRGGSALIALATGDAENAEVAQARLQEFLNDMRQPLNASVGDN